jgi:molybdenum cofactor biosynthesis enzyme MoaA
MCGICNLPESGKHINELSIGKWKKVFHNLYKLGIKTVKIMGGEPTERHLMRELCELFDFIDLTTDMKIALLSNSKWDSCHIGRLNVSGLYGYFTSVDTIDGDAIDNDTLIKSQRGYKRLIELRDSKFRLSLLAANVVISKKNISKIPQLVQKLSDEGFFVNLCTVQGYEKQAMYTTHKIDYEFRKKVNEYTFCTEMDYFNLWLLSKELLKMQKFGVKIAMAPDYLKNMANYGMFGGCWKCMKFSQLRIDSDGKAMFCNEFRGTTNLNLAYYPFNASTWCKEFITQWYEERPKYKCKCYWSCFVNAEYNIRIGSREFGYVNNPKLHRIGL